MVLVLISMFTTLLFPFFSAEAWILWKGVVGAVILRRAVHNIPPTASLYTVRQKLSAQDFRAPNIKHIFKEHVFASAFTVLFFGMSKLYMFSFCCIYIR